MIVEAHSNVEGSSNNSIKYFTWRGVANLANHNLENTWSIVKFNITVYSTREQLFEGAKIDDVTI